MTRDDSSFICANIDRTGFSDEMNDALDMAINALEQEPCDDCISRQAVKEQMIKYGFYAPDMTVTEFVEELPPVTPTRPKGKWILLGDIGECSECGQKIHHAYEWDFCPNCGADMRESEDEE